MKNQLHQSFSREEKFQLNFCCYEVREALLELCLSLQDASKSAHNSSSSSQREPNFKDAPALDLIDFLKTVIYTLLERAAGKKSLSRKMSSFEKSQRQEGNRFGRDISDIKGRSDISSQSLGTSSQMLGADVGVDDYISDHNAGSVSNQTQPPRQYEEMITKLESDIRAHIALENQMRIHIENLSNKIEEDERDKVDKEKELQEVKREKRRLDDLLTIRERELERMSGSRDSLEIKEMEIEELEKRLKQQEKKYEKHIAKLTADLLKYKKKVE